VRDRDRFLEFACRSSSRSRATAATRRSARNFNAGSRSAVPRPRAFSRPST